MYALRASAICLKALLSVTTFLCGWNQPTFSIANEKQDVSAVTDQQG